MKCKDKNFSSDNKIINCYVNHLSQVYNINNDIPVQNLPNFTATFTKNKVYPNKLNEDFFY